MKINYGIVAVETDKLLETKVEVLHFVGYENKPRKEDFAHLRHELKTDPDFAELHKVNFTLLPATAEMVEYYSKMVQ